jgi:ComF family protein
MWRMDLVVPVPLHLKRLGQRGFNQSAVMAGALGRRLDLPVRFDMLVRNQWTEPQTRLSRKERLENVKGAFEVSDRSSGKGHHILIVDDVFTTGTTLSECAKTLKAAGAAGVYALTVTRAIPDWKPSREGGAFDV